MPPFDPFRKDPLAGKTTVTTGGGTGLDLLERARRESAAEEP